MDISILNEVTSGLMGTSTEKSYNSIGKTEGTTGFDAILERAVNLVTETNDYQNEAESAEIKFALGESTSTHELLVAQEKANVALQCTVAIRDKVIEAYREIMNMQI